MAWAQSLIVVLHLIWAGVGMVALVRRLGLGVLAQTVSGLAFSLSGYLVARAWFASINAAVAWLPWIMLFAFDAVKNKDRRSWLKLGLGIGMQLLAGHAQTAWYTILLAGFWVAYLSWGTPPRESRKGRLRALILSEVGLGLAALLGVALAAVQLFPTAVYLMQSQRATAVDMEFALNYSFWPWRFLGLLAPGLFGSPVAGDYWGYGNFWEDAVYLGLLPFFLAVGALIKGIVSRKKDTDGRLLNYVHSRPRSFVTFLLVIISVAFLLALGKNSPITPWLYEHVPTFDMFQAPTRITIWAVYALALLAGIGIDNWRRPDGRGLYWTRLGAAGALAISIGAGLTYYAMGDVSPTFIRAPALAGFWALGAGVLALNAPEKSSRTGPSNWWSWAVVLWIAADLLVAGWGLNPGIDTVFYSEPAAIDQVQNYIGEGRVYLSTDNEDALKYNRFLRFDSFYPTDDWDALRASLLPNINMLDSIAHASNFDPLVPGRYHQWIESLDNVGSVKRGNLLDLMGVTVLEEVDTPHGDGVQFIPREGASRLRWVPCAVYVEDDVEAREQIFLGELDFENKVILEGAKAPQIPECLSNQGQVHIAEESPNELLIRIRSDASGWVVLSDIWYPGWQASLDGNPAQILQANFLFRAVKVPQGIHFVRLVYRPFEFYFGVVISLVAWCSFIVVGRKPLISHILR